MWRWREFKRGVYNLFYYFKIVRQDRDWDYIYYYYLLLKKIQKQRKRYEKNEYFYGQKYMIVQMRACEILMERIMNDYYTPEIGASDDEYRVVIEKEEYDFHLLWKILDRYIRHWWD